MGLGKLEFRQLASLEGRGLICRKTAYPSGFHQRSHAHENARFVFVLKGSFVEHFEQNTCTCDSFAVLFRPSREQHSDEYGPGEVVCISVDVSSLWLESLREIGLNLSESMVTSSGSLWAIANKLNIELAVRDVASSLAVEALLIEAAVEIARQSVNAINHHPPLWLERATKFIHEEYRCNLSIADVGVVAGVHPAHLSRVFRRFHRCTIGEYLRKLRVEAACRLLVAPNATVAEIALALGFADQAHLCKTFKSLTGITPTRYRRLIKR